MTQVGISPKVAAPTWLLVLLGAALTVAGVVADENTLVTVGLSLLGAAGVGGTAGYLAPAGEVAYDPEVEVGTPNDDALDEQAVAHLEEIQAADPDVPEETVNTGSE